MTSLRWLFTGLCVCVLSLATVGCETFNGDDDDDRDEDVVIGREPDNGDRIRGIPSGAERVKRGDGTAERVTYTPREDGTIYVYDADDNEVIYSGRLLDGERFVLDPVENEATVDGRRVLNTDLKKKHRYYLYFNER